jgi:hypothetical protein
MPSEFMHRKPCQFYSVNIAHVVKGRPVIKLELHDTVAWAICRASPKNQRKTGQKICPRKISAREATAFLRKCMAALSHLE